MPFVAFITVLLCWMGLKYGMITRGCALAFLGLFVLFLGYLYIIAKKNKTQNIEIKQISGKSIALYIIGGLIALIIGGHLTVDSAVDIARRIGVSERIIGLTVIAFGTSVPELVTCVVAALKKQSDIAIGNIIGSNIFNILFVLGLSGLISPIPFDAVFIVDGALALLAVIMLILFTSRNKRLGRFAGIIFVIMYAIYVASLVIGK